MLGTALIDAFSEEVRVIAVSRQSVYEKPGVCRIIEDISRANVATQIVQENRPDVVIHCAAIVDLDHCEDNYQEAFDLHVESTRELGNSLNTYGGHLVYISTDSVFDGSEVGLYTENDSAHPLNSYAKTKLEGEVSARVCQNCTIIRTNIFGWSRAEKLSFAEWLIKSLVCQKRLNMFTDVYYTPIHVSHLAEIINKIVTEEVFGLYHVPGSDMVSKYDFAIILAKIFNLSDEPICRSSIDSSQLKVRRPKNMALAPEKIEQRLEVQMPGVQEGINLLKEQYHSGWLEKIKSRRIGSEYKFWEKNNVEI